MFILIYIVAFILASIFSQRFRYYWKKHTKATYWLTFFGFLALALITQGGGSAGSWIYDQCVNADAMVLLAFPLPLIYGARRKKDADFQMLRNMFEGNVPYNRNQPGVPSPLPKKPEKRAKIVRKFSAEFGLNLTEEEVQNIVAASFLNGVWANELLAMGRKYSHPTEWYNGPTQWLRIYMKVFLVQNITSDIAIQREIVEKSLNDIFTYIDQHSFTGIAQCIDDINMRYFTTFDDMTFMYAYRFLEANGYRHQLPATQIMTAHGAQEDDLVEKYLQ